MALTVSNPRSRHRKQLHTALVLLVLLGPAVVMVAGVLGYAVVSGAVTSLFRVEVWTLGTPFVGLENYQRLFRSPTFINSLTRSLIFVGGTIVLGSLISMAFALVLHAVRWGRGLFRAIALVPYLVSGVAAAVMWRFLFTGETSLVNMGIVAMGGTSIPWLARSDLALVVVTLANVWFISPFSTLILLGGLQSIDPQLYEAATIDGARSHQSFWHITMPSIAPMLALSFMWLSFASFNMFDIILPLTGGGPGRATEVLAVHMFQLAFRDLNYSTASAVMVVLLVINVGFSLLYLRIFRVR
jgi:ABC-type sugar transport system permease subunit